jgi:hypothetical protein
LKAGCSEQGVEKVFFSGLSQCPVKAFHLSWLENHNSFNVFTAFAVQILGWTLNSYISNSKQAHLLMS